MNAHDLDPVIRHLSRDLAPLGSMRRAEVLDQETDLIETRLIDLDRKAQAGTLSQHEALERARLWVYHDWLEREGIAAYGALDPATADHLRSA